MSHSGLDDILNDYYKRVSSFKKSAKRFDSMSSDIIDMERFSEAARDMLEDLKDKKMQFSPNIRQFNNDTKRYKDKVKSDLKDIIANNKFDGLKSNLVDINDYMNYYYVDCHFTTNDVIDDMDSFTYTYDNRLINKILKSNNNKRLDVRTNNDGVSVLCIDIKPKDRKVAIVNDKKVILDKFSIRLNIENMLSENQEYNFTSGTIEELTVRRCIDKDVVLNQAAVDLVKTYSLDGNVLGYVLREIETLIKLHSNGYTECRFDIIGLIDDDLKNNKLLGSLEGYL